MNNDIHIACMNNNYDAVERLVRDRTNLNYTNNIGETPLFIACKYNNFRIAKFLIRCGCNLNDSTFFKYTPLHIAAINKHYDIVKLLVNNGASIDNKNRYNGNTALHEACKNGCCSVIIFLLTKKKDLCFIKNNDNKSPLFLIEDDSILESIMNNVSIDYMIHVLCKNRKIDLLLTFFKKGLNVNWKDEDGNTALHILCEQQDIELVYLLLENGADPTIENNNQETPLHKACEKGITEIVELLIKNENLNLQNKDGMTPMHLACKENHLKIVSILITHDINLSLKTKDNYIPLYYACLHNNFDMVNILLQNSSYVDKEDIQKSKKNIHNLDIVYLLDKYNCPEMTYQDFFMKNPFYIKHLQFLNNIKNIQTIRFTFSLY